jgi:ABC-type polysaccharide/polyol phosphate transport system ATPase subunit
MSLIEIDKVSKAFQIPSVHRTTVREHLLGLLEPRRFQRLQVLDDVSFEVRQGEALGIMGRNGSGKSTLLKVVCGVYLPDQGRVTARAAITSILELGVGWNAELDAVDNVLLIGSVMGLTLKEIRRSLDEILAFAELERFANMKLKHYSSGMSERLGYAVAFKAVRDVLVLDEIFAVGDAEFQRKCFATLEQFRARGKTILFVSHTPSSIRTMCDRVCVLEHGRLQFDGSVDEGLAFYEQLTQAPVVV